MLVVDNIDVAYGQVQVLYSMSLQVERGEILCVLGRNGAGKTTTLKSIMGLLPLRQGQITLDGASMSSLPPHKIPTAGIAYVPQGRRLFSELSVKQNMDVGLMASGAGRETLDQVDGNHNLTGINKAKVHDPDNIAKTTGRETLEELQYGGHVESKQRSDGYLIKDVHAKITNRETTTNEYAGVPDGDVNGGGTGYLTANMEAPETIRQFTSDYEYEGPAKGINQTVSYDNIYNATLNDMKEITLEMREPTQENEKLTYSKEDMNIDIRKIEEDIINSRDIIKTNDISAIPDMSLLGETTGKNILDDSNIADRNNPDMISAFQNNPYTKSLNSY